MYIFSDVLQIIIYINKYYWGEKILKFELLVYSSQILPPTYFELH